MNRRHFLTQAAAAGSTLSLGSVAKAQTDSKIFIVGVSCSARQGKTTATAVQAALDGARAVSDRIETRLIDLGGLKVSGWVGGAKPDSPEPVNDDYATDVEPYLLYPNLGGLIIGSPVYFRSMSAQCKAFLERIYTLRTPTLRLADKPVGALAVGAYRNGGQELTIEQITTAMLCHEVFVVGGKPKAHQGATLWNAYNDDILKDEFGIDSAKKLGARIAEAALAAAKK